MKLQPSAEAQTTELSLDPIRVETVLSRFPIHRLSKKGEVSIAIQNQGSALLWEVSYNSRYGQPGPLAYKLDTLVINRRIERAGKPVPKIIRLGSLPEIAKEIGHTDAGLSIKSIKDALLQNAFSSIRTKLIYKTSEKNQKKIDAAFTRYSVVFTGESLPDGRKSDAVYIILNDIYMEVLNSCIYRPLDYNYMKKLAPGSQRFYEIVSYPIYFSILHGNSKAKMSYSEFCILSTITRYENYDNVKKQMYKIHRSHMESGYISKIEYEISSDSEGNPDWIMVYTPGPLAYAQFRGFQGKESFPEEQEIVGVPGGGEALAVTLPKDAVGTLLEELIAQGMNRTDAERLAEARPEECRRQLAFLPYVGEFRTSPGAYLRDAIEKGYGPPAAYVSAREREAAEALKNSRIQANQVRRAAEEERCRALLEEWATLIDRDEKGVLAAFWEHCRQQRDLMCDKFRSPRLRRAAERAWEESPRQAHACFAYFAGRSCPQPELAQWLARPQARELQNWLRREVG